MTTDEFPFKGLRLTQTEIDSAHKALDAVELIVSDAAQSVADHRIDDARLVLGSDTKSSQTMRTTVIAAALLLGLREIAQAIREIGAA